MLVRYIAGALLIISLVCGCSAEKKAVEAVAVKRGEALNTRNTGLYLSLLAKEYQDNGKDLQAKSSEIETTLNSFDTIAYRSLDRTIAVSGDTATVSGSYSMKITLKGKPLELAGKETIRLKKGPDGWKIVGGI